MSSPTAEQAEKGTKSRGRPKGSGGPPEDATKPRSVRLNDMRWATLQDLGREWLEKAIDDAQAIKIAQKKPPQP